MGRRELGDAGDEVLGTVGMKRLLQVGLIAALIVMVLVMGLVVLIGAPATASGAGETTMSHAQCPACLAVVVTTTLFVALMVRYLPSLGERFAALCHPAPLDPPPRPA